MLRKYNTSTDNGQKIDSWWIHEEVLQELTNHFLDNFESPGTMSKASSKERSTMNRCDVKSISRVGHSTIYNLFKNMLFYIEQYISLKFMYIHILEYITIYVYMCIYE